MLLTRFGCAVTLSATLALAAGVPAAAQEASTAEQTIDVMNTLFGKHPGARANHAKGVVAEGSFTPSAEAARISKASLFKGPAVPVTIRFSDATGVPTIPDGSANANPHGMALKFKLSDGSDMDVVTNALKYFPVATGEEFRDLLKAVADSGPNAAHPTALERFASAHPAAATAGGTAKTPSSLARQTYNGVNAFIFVDAAGKRQPFRFRIEPVQGEEILSSEDAAKRDPNYLMTEIGPRIAKEPAKFRILAQLAEPGDPTNDATKPWPDDRKTIDLGTLTVSKAVPDSAEAEKALLFMPNNLTDGIEVSDDPLIDARVQAYAVSFSRRSQ
ncbi:catalase family peroxidase [Methylobacterium mesophilicum SR1.6/6]|uniref:Catalase-related peroxidase n=1 Tax=Methylobacterium mesophilicum SR1.6/6 TaxID=908290 RepID=A0A6B9FWF4_9HYPH|nr:catalase family peroxidase [Methylobacterium mesophilicum]QGY05064.1 catalase family peroxidase [Methylobacterium mesophilicum SR1.6/6]